MKKDSAKSNKINDLRERAEEILQTNTGDLQKISDKAVRSLVHELQVHQIELEMQNEELRRAQIELEESRNRYSDLYDFAPICYFTFDKNGLILAVNLTGANKLGVERSFLIKKPFSLYIVPDSKDAFYLHLRQVFKIKTQQSCEIKLVDKNKNQFDARLESLAIKDGKDNFSQCRTAIIDITESKKAEEAICESEERYRNLVESANDIIATVSLDGIIISLNPAFERITGWACEEWLGKSFPPLIHPDDLSKAMEIFQHTMSGKTMPGSELRLLANSGGYIYVEYVTAPLLKDGKVIGNLNIVRDITERKKAQEALKRARDELEIRVKERTAELSSANESLQAETTERRRAEKEMKLSEEKYRELANSISDPFFALNNDLRFTYWNRTSEKNTGISADSIIGKYLFDVFPELKDTQIERGYNEAIATGKVQFLENNRWDQQGGTVTYHDVNIYPTADGIAVFSRDVTERKKMEELVLENERLISANRAKSEFVTIMSHELRTPLTSVIGYSIILKGMTHGKLNEKQEFFIDNILASSKHLLDVINDVLDLARIEAGKLELVIESMPLHGTISEIVNLMKERAKMKNIILKKELDPQLLHIEADRQKFKQILFNLLSNAMKFSKEGGGIITVSTKKEGDMAKISVSDTGIGIKLEDISKLFHRFEQLDSGLSRKYEGAGLGLAITKQLVELHGGRITVESRYGEGSSFTFFLPAGAKN